MSSKPHTQIAPSMSGKLMLDHLIAFGRLLRDLGLSTGPGEMVDLARALEHISLGQREDFKAACRALLIHRREDLPIFEQAWDYFWSLRWRTTNGPALLPQQAQTIKPPARLRRLPAEQDVPQLPQTDRKKQELELIFTYSAIEMLRAKDFADCTAEEIEAIQQLIAEMRYRIEPRRTRRRAPRPRGGEIDMRRAFRRSLRTGGELLNLPERARKQRQRPLIILCDISGSMERYSRLLLHFAHAVGRSLNDVEVFVFGTRLTRITRLLHHRDIDETLRLVGQSVQDWSGGTRIGEALKTFNFQWGRRVLGRGAVALLISDGWDRGEPRLLAREMARLQRNVYRLIWLNPLLGSPDYQPLTRGMQAALPLVDDFLPVHNLRSLEQLGEMLEHIGRHRPERRQHTTGAVDFLQGG